MSVRKVDADNAVMAFVAEHPAAIGCVEVVAKLSPGGRAVAVKK